MLARCDFVVQRFDLETHLVELRGDLAADQHSAIHRIDVEVAGIIVGDEAAFLPSLGIEQEELRFASGHEIPTQIALRLLHDALQILARVALVRRGAFGAHLVGEDVGHDAQHAARVVGGRSWIRVLQSGYTAISLSLMRANP